MKELKQLIDSKQWIEAKHYILNNLDRIEEIANFILGCISKQKIVRPTWQTVYDSKPIHEVTRGDWEWAKDSGQLSEKPTWCVDDLQFKKEYEGEFSPAINRDSFQRCLIDMINHKTGNKFEVAIAWHDIEHHLMIDILLDGDKFYCGVVIKKDDLLTCHKIADSVVELLKINEKC